MTMRVIVTNGEAAGSGRKLEVRQEEVGADGNALRGYSYLVEPGETQTFHVHATNQLIVVEAAETRTPAMMQTPAAKEG